MGKRIIIYGFGDFAVTMLEVVKQAMDKKCNIDWGVILPTSHYYDRWKGVLPESHILLLSEKLNEKSGEFDPNRLKNYSGCFYHDLETDKKYFTKKTAAWRERQGFKTYEAYKAFLEEYQPHAVISPAIESVDGVILTGLCRELNIRPMVYTHARNLEKSFWALDQNEKIPEVTHITNIAMEEARSYLCRFRNEYISSTSYSPKYFGEDAQPVKIEISGLFTRIARYLGRVAKDPNQRNLKTLRVSIQNNLPFIRDTIWNLRKESNKKYFQIASVDELPEKFIFYPLQYSPESSINVPAPYFADQKRAIDAIRMNMPSNYILIVKEHPVCMAIRKREFIKSLMKMPGVRVIKYDVPSIEIIKRSALVMSVTGTATLEAFLLGKPSMTLGDVFFSEFLGGSAGTSTLKERIRQKLEEQISDDYIVECIARVFSVCEDFTIRAMNLPPTLFKGNIAAILRSIQRNMGETDE